jgi:hypothetical protein
MARGEQATPREIKVPELRLRTDMPMIDVNKDTSAQHVLDSIRNEPSGALLVRELGGTSAAVVVSLDRYLDLAGKELAGSQPRSATLDGRLVPRPEVFDESHVEQVDPTDSWSSNDPSRLM